MLKRVQQQEEERDEELESIIKIMKKSAEQRTREDIQELQQYMKDVNFFEQLIENYDVETFYECLRYVQHQYIREGTTFYVMLRGQVGVLVYASRNNGIQKNNLIEVKVLGQGQSFGEIALIENCARSATIKCKRNCHFAVLDKIHFQRILKEKEEQRLIKQLSFLFNVHFFTNWNYNSLKHLYLHSFLKTYLRNQIIYKEQDTPESIFIIKVGDFKVTKDVSVGEGYDECEETQYLKGMQRGTTRPKTKTLDLAILSAGQVFGEEDIIRQRRRHFTVTCISGTSEVLEITKKDFQSKILSENQTKKLILESINTKEDWYQKRYNELKQLISSNSNSNQSQSIKKNEVISQQSNRSVTPRSKETQIKVLPLNKIMSIRNIKQIGRNNNSNNNVSTPKDIQTPKDIVNVLRNTRRQKLFQIDNLFEGRGKFGRSIQTDLRLLLRTQSINNITNNNNNSNNKGDMQIYIQSQRSQPVNKESNDKKQSILRIASSRNIYFNQVVDGGLTPRNQSDWAQHQLKISINTTRLKNGLFSASSLLTPSTTTTSSSRIKQKFKESLYRLSVKK